MPDDGLISDGWADPKVTLRLEDSFTMFMPQQENWFLELLRRMRIRRSPRSMVLQYFKAGSVTQLGYVEVKNEPCQPS